MKKLLFITLNDHVPWGGSEELWSKTALSLTEQHNVTVVKRKWDEEEHQYIKQIKSSGGIVLYKSQINNKKNILSRIQRKLGEGKNVRHDLEVVSNISDFSLAILSAGDHVDSKIITYSQYLKKHNIPYVVLIQLATSLRFLHDNQITKFKQAYNDAKGVGCLSQENRDVIETQLGLSLSNVFKINNPFNYKQEYLLPETKKGVYQVACVAAYTMFHKGQDLLLKVLSQEKWKTRNISFNLYGKGINEFHFRELIKLYGIEKQVVLKGHVISKETIWKENIACIMPSRMEGQSLAMLEAMSFGRMVISTAVGAAGELIEHGKTGFLAKAPTIELLDQCLEEAWGKREKWVLMGKSSRSKLFEVMKQDPIDSFSSKINELIK